MDVLREDFGRLCEDSPRIHCSTCSKIPNSNWAVFKCSKSMFLPFPGIPQQMQTNINSGPNDVQDATMRLGKVSVSATAGKDTGLTLSVWSALLRFLVLVECSSSMSSDGKKHPFCWKQLERNEPSWRKWRNGKKCAITYCITVIFSYFSCDLHSRWTRDSTVSAQLEIFCAGSFNRLWGPNSSDWM